MLEYRGRRVIKVVLGLVVLRQDAFPIPKLWSAMARSVRNLGWRGLCVTAISAVDVAPWDPKARLFDGNALIAVTTEWCKRRLYQAV